MGNPPPGGTSILTITSCILALWVMKIGAQMSQDYGCPSQEKILPCRCSTRGMEFQIWCSHSELPSVLEGLKAVSHYVTRPVDELILENNNLPSLPGNVFTSLRVLRLMLRNNRLERVSSSWLEGLHDSLLELFIVEPDLRSLPIDSLENLQGLEAVTLQSKTMKRLPRFTGLAKLRYLQINSPSLMELSPLYFRDLPRIEEIHVFGSPRLSRLEAGLFRNLPRLSIVNITGNALSWIHPRSLIDLPELKEIALNDNEIDDASIVGRSIVDLPSLTIVNLDGNRISRLSESDFVDNPSLNRLTIARNFITTVASGAFQRLTNLRILDLSHNRVRRVSSEFFLQRTGTGLEELWLVDNEIHHFTELRAILEACPGLKILDISHNFIEEIPFGALRGHPTLERLHLDHNRLSFLQRDSFVAMPALRELRLRNNSLNDLLETPFWNLPGLKGLDLSQNYFRHLQPRLLANLPNLRRLDLSGNGIAIIETDSFVETAALEHINISGNALSMIHPMTFRRLTSLYELDVGWNRLLQMVPSLPRNIEHLHLTMNRIVALPSVESRDLALPALRSLDLSANGIEIIIPGALGELSALRKLNLGYNAMRLLDDGTFTGLPRLEQLDLRYNRLLSLHGRSLKPLRNLMDLNIRGNRLEVIRNDLFQENVQLQRLDISRNNLAQIPHATFSSTRDLRELYASHNTLTELPSSLHGLTALEILDLSFNKLNILSPETLSSLTSLLELKLVRNRIKELREGAFDRLPRLTFIDLENNDLRIVEKHAIRSLPELQSLRLGKNRLRNIPNGAFTDLPLLQSAELQDNRIQEIARNAFINVPHLLFLNLSNNQLPDIDHVGLESLRSLEVLDLGNNRISKISSNSFAFMEWLVELKMDHNRICGIQGSPFDDMPRLRVLSLRSNRMTTVKEKAFSRLRSNIAVLDIDGNPLSCSCDMLWLRGWLQQASTHGPRCADGSLFREIRLSRQDCQRTKHTESIYSGCEADSVDAAQSSMSSMPYTSASDDSSPDWMNLRDPPKGHQASQNLDYLMYEDYPSDRATNSSETMEIQSSTTPIITSTSTSHVTSAAQPPFSSEKLPSSSNKKGSQSANSVTQKIPNRNKNPLDPPSPGSSGFTFFGVPLPSINFSLWGNSGRRKAQRKDDNAKYDAHRPGRSRYRVFPPTEPEIHRGGFFPLPQGQSGFVPIPDPRFSISGKSPVTNETKGVNLNRTATITRVYQMPRKQINHKIASNMEKNPQSTAGDTLTVRNREESTTLRNDDSALSSSTNSRRVSSNVADDDSSAHEISIDQRKRDKALSAKTESSSLPTEVAFLPTALSTLSAEVSSPNNLLAPSTGSYDNDTVVIDDPVTKKVIWTRSDAMKTLKEDNSTEDIETIEDTRIKKIGIWDVESRLPPVKGISAESVDNENTENYRLSVSSDFDDERTSAIPKNGEILEPSALSALLIPGGQVPASTSSRPPPGRSTIVKVASPHSGFNRDSNNNGESPDSANISTSKETKNADSLLDATVKMIEDNPFNWYFQNYNESDIEPYVAVVYSGAPTTSITTCVILVIPFYITLRGFV